MNGHEQLYDQEPGACCLQSPIHLKCPCFFCCCTVSVAEVEALSELYRKLSNELHKDNLIHRDEFMWALFKANRDNLFAERVSFHGCRCCCQSLDV